MSQDVITVSSTMKIPLLYRGEYSQWRERFMNYLEEQIDGEAMINSIQNDSNETSKDLWDALEWKMRGSEYGEQDRKAAILYEYETFKANEGEQLLDTYLRYLQVIYDLKKCGYKKDNCELNYKFLNNLQPKWKQYGTLMKQTKNLIDINIDALYNILKQNQGDVNDALGYKKKAIVITSYPLALVAEKTNMSKQKEKVIVSLDSEGSEFVKSNDKKEDKKADEKKRDMSKVKCHNCKKEGHFAKDCKKAKEINANMVFMAQIKKVLSKSNESSSSAEETIAKVAYYTSESKSESEFETSKYYDNFTNYGLFVNNDDDQEIFHDAIESAGENFIENHINSQIDYDKSEVDHNDSEEKEHLVDKIIRKFNQKIIIDLGDEVVSILEKEKANLETIESLKSKGFEASENASSETENQSENNCHVFEKECDKVENLKVIAPGLFKLSVSQSVSPISMLKTSCDSNNVEIKLKRKRHLLSCNNSHLGETSSDYVCNDAMNVFCNSRMCDLFDDNNFFIFDNESVRISPVSKTPFRKKPHDSMNVRSKSNSNQSLPRTVHRCYLLNDYEDVGKLKAKGDIGVFIGYSKESTAFRIYNKRTRKIHESVNVNFDEISEMASKHFSLEPGLSNLNKTGRSSNLVVSQASEALKKDLEDLFQNFYDEYFDSSKIMKSLTTNVETSINEEVFHEVSESFQGESSSSSLNDDVQQSPEKVILPQTNTQSISNNMIPNVNEASTSHNVFNECLKDAYFDASTSFHDLSNVHTYYQPYSHEKK
nr:hypothetical protein [Tanacetum cinerariifolium]